LQFMATTVNLSPEGVSFVMPQVSVDERYCASASALRLQLELPTGNIQLEARVVHCRRVNEHAPDRGWQFGTQITDIEAQARATYLAYFGRNALD